jgi:hypothetical protein
VAQAAVMPLMAIYFNRFPLVGIIANLPVGFLASLASSLGVALYFVSILGGWLELLLAGLIEYILVLIRFFLEFFYNLPSAVIQTASFDWPTIFLYWITLYMFYELIFKRRFSAKGVITGLICFNLIVWPKVFTKKPIWAIEFIDIGRNHAWIYTDRTGEKLGCFDIYHEDRYTENILMSNILNFHGGRLDWLVTSTPDSRVIKTIKESFSPNMVDLNDSPKNKTREKIAFDKKLSGHPDWIKFIWEQSDNTEKGSHILACMQLDAGEYLLIMAGWSGMQVMQEFKSDKRIALLELPWSAYARTDCMNMIERLNPECVVFSQDRFSTIAPWKRSDLTHSPDRVFSTSICGGFGIAEFDGGLQIRTMKSAGIEE